MKILVACEESQAVTKEFRKLGHEAYSCDTEPCSGGHHEWHLQVDAIELLKIKWDMIIAFPPCTFLSNAGACRLYPKKGQLDQVRFEKGLVAKKFFMEFYNSDCPKVVIENPVSSKVFEMPPHTQEIQPYEHGHPFTKKTRLWVRGVPFLRSSNEITPTGPYIPAGTSRKDKGKYGASRCGGSGKTRSKTFPGIAKAMADQWG